MAFPENYVSNDSEGMKFSFFRNYGNYTGGHKKFKDYLMHTLQFEGTEASLFINNQSLIEPDLFKEIPDVNYQAAYNPLEADVAFLAGMDWLSYSPFFSEQQIKVNLIQHVRHTDPSQPLRQFLSHRAIRLCVSASVLEAIEPLANGPCFHIKMGHDIPVLAQTNTLENDVYIFAVKQPDLGLDIANALTQWGLKVKLQQDFCQHVNVVQDMSRSEVVITLPHLTEGFYLPGLEAMRLSSVAVIPDCVANREYCKPYTNTVVCSHEPTSILNATERALHMAKQWRNVIRCLYTESIVSGYSLATERRQYHDILKDLRYLWTQ